MIKIFVFFFFSCHIFRLPKVSEQKEQNEQRIRMYSYRNLFGFIFPNTRLVNKFVFTFCLCLLFEQFVEFVGAAIESLGAN